MLLQSRFHPEISFTYHGMIMIFFTYRSELRHMKA